MTRPPRRPETNRLPWLKELLENFNIEFVGLLVFLVGGLALLSLLPGGGPYAQGLPWLTRMVGWIAPYAALSLLICGAIFMLGQRAGFWSIEALLGAELLLLGLIVNSFLRQNHAPVWDPQLDGANGGLVGTTLGSLLLAGFGRGPALVLGWLATFVGLLLLVRYTPLRYVAFWLMRAAPLFGSIVSVIGGWWQAVARPSPQSLQARAALPNGNFVPPRESIAPPTGNPQARTPVTPSRMAAGEAPTSQANPEAPDEQTSAKPMRRHATKGAQAPATDSREAALAPAAPGALPGLDVLNPEHEIQQAVDVRGLQDLIELTLADFNVPVKTVHVETGPTVTQFGVEPLYL
jgi:hypothetical protein